MKAVWLAAFTLCACSTGASRRSFELQVASKTSSAPNDEGWTVKLDKAEANLGPVRFFEGKALLSKRFDPWSLIISTAYAHPGHYQAGTALAEALDTATVNLLAPDSTSVGPASGVTGAYGSMQLTLTQAHVVGTATKDGESVVFDATGSLDKTIEGIPFDQEVPLEGGHVNITVDLTAWLSRIDFITAGVPNAQGVHAFPTDSEAYNGFVRGLEDTSAYVVTWSAD